MVFIDDDDRHGATSHRSIAMLPDESDRIPSTTLAVLRGILVKSLSRENLTLTDQQQLLGARRDRHVQFSLAGNRDASAQKQSRPSSANRELQKEREERIKQMKERQNEERQKKLEELKAQALAAQKFREQKEEERRRRMDDLRRRENDRRSQVEERRRAIIEADNERREYILRKNQERDQRMETKRRNDRGSIQFAFGSSTPRMIDTSDSGMCSSFWAHRRATSITNVAYTGAALTRRSSERELTDGAAKKRATSASGLDRSTDGRAFSMTRLDQLATPRRRNGEHISAIVERERRQALELDNLTRLSLSSSRSSPTGTASKRMSRSMSQLAGGGGGGSGGAKYRNQSQDSSSGRSYGGGGGRKSLFNSSINSGSSSPMRRTDTSKSMSQLNAATNLSVGSGPRATTTKTERLRHQYQQQQQSPSHQQQQLTNGLRSGEMTPTSLNTSRPGSALSSSTTASGVVYRRSLPAQRKARPASIAVTGVTASGLKEEKPPLPKTGSGASAAGFTHGGSKLRLSSAGSGSINTTPVKSASGTETPTRKPLSLHSAEKRAARGAITSRVPSTASASTPLQSPGPEKAARNLQDSLKKSAEATKKLSSASDDKPVPKQQPAKQEQELPVEVKVEQKQQEPVVLLEELSVAAPVQPETMPQEPLLEFEQPSGQNSEQQPIVQLEWQQQLPVEVSTVVQPETILIVTEDVVAPTASAAISELELVSPVKQQEPDGRDTAPETTVAPVAEVQESNLVAVDAGAGGDAMTASMIAKRITTEEEAKAALAERRRLAREEAERQAELERQRIEAEEQAERQRVLDEEERLRKLEEETIRLAEEQRRTEDERLQQAIEEARRRDEEDRKRREEEARQKVEREEAERKAREEAERQRLEMVERLKKEEKEREERRKRVEAIMSRTRAKGTANNTPTKNNEDDKENSMSKSQIVLSSTPAALPTGTAMSASTISMTDSFIASEIRQEQEQQHLQQQNSQESLEKTMESLSLSNNNINATHSSSNSSSNSSSSETIANNNNNNNNGGNNSIEFERSVTDKENMLLASGGGGIPAANNNLNNGTSGGTSNGTSGPTSTDCALNDVPMVMTTANGKADPATSNGSHGSSTNSTSDLIIEDALMGQTNGHKNGTIDNVFEEHVADAMPLRTATVPLEIADFLSPKRQSYDLCAAAAGTFDPFSPYDDGSYDQDADQQQHSSFDSSATSSTATTDTTTVTTTGTGAVAGYAQLIDFASLPTADDDDTGSNTNDSNFNPLTAPFGGAHGSSDTQHHPFDYHNLSNNNSINLFDITSYDDGSSSTTTNTTTTKFNNNNNASIANPRLVSATSDGQEHRDLSLL
ncbi:ensconsin-like isoform X2 [Anopheles bellator]|uniref:ensconsin-like isoform X2 n=1 Tax=Anopheles bellator TaxID=139047 RepID=UPI0026491796|nr:ensconsin-like isoform X2 [Anopheles bellator]